ncbi:MAG: hypothetical protein E7070_04010 [Bacteroidales bacterium]|jgi:hypothetical protein|nr:hypothetical protein [Bacteroidales bacterium]
MARDQDIYIDFWESYLDFFVDKFMHGGTMNDKTIDCNKLVTYGDRQKYTFHLLLENGKVSNNIGGSAVARDLYKVLSSHSAFDFITKKKRIAISLKSDCSLDIIVEKITEQQ